MNALETEDSILVTDGFHIFCRRWNSESPAKKTIVCIPGTGGNSEFFRPIGLDLATLACDVYALDLRGFGNSVEKNLQRGDTSSFKRHLQDLQDAVHQIKHTSTKVFIFGHSHGCAYSLWLAANYPGLVDGLILAAPPIAATSKVHHRSYLKFAFLLLAAPKTMYSFGQPEPDSLASNPLIARRLSIRWLYGSKKYLLDPLFKNASRVKLPTLIFQGSADTSTLPEGAKILQDKLGSTDKSIIMFQGADHFLYGAVFPSLESGETENRHRVANAVNDWLNLHI